MSPKVLGHPSMYSIPGQACLLSEFLESYCVTRLRRAEFFGQLEVFFSKTLEFINESVFFVSPVLKISHFGFKNLEIRG